MDQGRTKDTVPPRRGPVSTKQHDERQLLVTKRATRRDPARPDSDTTVQIHRGEVPGHCGGGLIPLVTVPLKACGY